MSVDDNGKVVDLAEKFNIKELLEQTAARREQEKEAAASEPPKQTEAGVDTVPSLEKLAALPKPGDHPYKAYARPDSQMLPTLHLLKSDGQKWSYPYSCRVEGPHMLFPDDPGKGGIIVLRFAASVSVEVLIAGIRLDELHNYLGDHRIRWVREFPHGKMVVDDTIPMVRNIIVRPVTAELQKDWPISALAEFAGK